MTEKDPHGKGAHEPGAKLDAGKVRPALVLRGFARALLEVSKVGTYGATKYTENGWMEVPNGVDRYSDAKMRHWFKDATGETHDPDTKLFHKAHEAWNVLAELELMLRQQEREYRHTETQRFIYEYVNAP
ncbi:MAG: dATP/dGTP diphosphohydrolase domain-containing protein [Shewanella sp.]